MRAERKRKGKENFNVHALPVKDRKVLEHAARLLNKSVSELLDGPVEEDGDVHAITGAPHFSQAELQPPAPSSMQAMPPSIQLTNAHPWTPVSLMPDTVEQYTSLHVASTPRTDQGFVTHLNSFGINDWHGAELMLNEDHQSLWIATAAPVGTTISLGAQPVASNQEAVEAFREDSDESSTTSENDDSNGKNGNNLDGQPWETVQIPSVDLNPPPSDQSGSDFVWLYDDPEVAQDAPERLNPDSSNENRQDVRISQF